MSSRNVLASPWRQARHEVVPLGKGSFWQGHLPKGSLWDLREERYLLTLKRMVLQLGFLTSSINTPSFGVKLHFPRSKKSQDENEIYAIPLMVFLTFLC
jgi:hypothetical protein